MNLQLAIKALLLLTLALNLPAQSPAFQVATIRPSRPDQEAAVNFTLGPGDAYTQTGGRLIARGISLLDYIRFAYKLNFAQANTLQADAPKWLANNLFDIEARADSSNPTKDQMRLMMQTLLRDRFGLRVHTEERSLPALVLVPAKGGRLGSRLRPHPLDAKPCSSPVPAAGSRGQDPSQTSRCGVIAASGVPDAPSRLHVEGHAVTLAQLATQLGQMGQYNRPIVDRTGLPGTYDLTLDWGPEASPQTSPAADPSFPQSGTHEDGDVQSDLQRALTDQLGLRLERQNAILPVVLIDHINPQPTPN